MTMKREFNKNSHKSKVLFLQNDNFKAGEPNRRKPGWENEKCYIMLSFEC